MAPRELRLCEFNVENLFVSMEFYDGQDLEHVSEDDKTRGEKDIQKLTDDHIKQIDGLIHTKEAEIMEV